LICSFHNSQTKQPTTGYVPGKLVENSLGLSLSQGLEVKLVAETGKRVAFTSPQASSSTSSLSFHQEPDGAAIFPLSNGGYVYVSNAEATDGGGVYGVEFDSSGRVRNYKALLTGTSKNCVS